MFRVVVLLAVIVGALPHAAIAADQQREGVALPGSVWIAAGNVGPGEPRNELAQTGFEQGIVAWQKQLWFVVPYIAVGFSDDTAGHAWNNRHPVTLAVKLVRQVPGCIVQVGGGVMFETDPATGAERHPTLFGQYWTGWTGDRPYLEGRSPVSFPGYVWASSGTLTGRDPRNWITSFAAQQGVRVLRLGHVSAVPFAGVGGSADSKRRPWENRLRYEAGIKSVVSILGGSIEAGVAERQEHRFISGTRSAGPIVFVNLWFGWNPRPF